MEFRREDLLSPANFISLGGFALSVYGATHLGDASGIAEAGAGRVLDLVDGPVARRTHSSQFGAYLDATLDKTAMAVILAEAWYQHAAPEPVIGAVALFNVINAAANVYAKHKGTEIGTSKAGKHAMFGQNLAVGLFLIGNVVGTPEVDMAAWGVAAASVPSSVKASYDYTRQAINTRKKSPALPKAKNYQYQKR